MSERDEWDEKAAELLPLHEAKTTYQCKDNLHCDCAGIVQGLDAGSWSICVCNCHFQSPVAAALRDVINEYRAEIERLKRQINEMLDVAKDWRTT